MYVGSSQARAILRQYEFFYPKQAKVKKVKDKGKKKVPGESKQDLVKFDVLLTSYEMINLDTAILRALKWECLVNFSSLGCCTMSKFLTSSPTGQRGSMHDMYTQFL